MQDRPTFGALSNQGLCHLCSVANTTENLSENEFTNKKQFFGFWRKYLSYNFHLWENACHRVFIKFSVRMELYETVWKEISHLWELYDKHFWSTRDVSSESEELKTLPNYSPAVICMCCIDLYQNMMIMKIYNSSNSPPPASHSCRLSTEWHLWTPPQIWRSPPSPPAASRGRPLCSAES